MKTLTLGIALSLLLLVRSQSYNVVFRSSCPKVPLMENLNLSRLAGQWYEISRHPNPWEYGKCVQLNQRYYNDTLLMHWEQIVQMKGEEAYSGAECITSPEKPNKTSKLSMLFTKPAYPYPTPYWILESNYDTYYVAYACQRHFFSKKTLQHLTISAEFSWIMSRTRTLDRKVVNDIKRRLRSYGVMVRLMKTIDQMDCDQKYDDATEKIGSGDGTTY